MFQMIAILVIGSSVSLAVPCHRQYPPQVLPAVRAHLFGTHSHPWLCQTSIGQAFAQSALLRSLGAFLISPVARTSALSSRNHFEYHGIGSLRSKSGAAPEMLRGTRLILGAGSHLSCRARGGSGGLSSPTQTKLQFRSVHAHQTPRRSTSTIFSFFLRN